jgi:hypothetical protein
LVRTASASTDAKLVALSAKRWRDSAADDSSRIARALLSRDLLDRTCAAFVFDKHAKSAAQGTIAVNVGHASLSMRSDDHSE